MSHIYTVWGTARLLDYPSVMTLVSTIISRARALKLDTIAEGVESEEQVKILRLHYLISKPLSFDALTSYLGRPLGQETLG